MVLFLPKVEYRPVGLIPKLLQGTLMDTFSTKHLITVDNNNLRPMRNVAVVDHLMEVSKTKGFWPFVDEVMKVWEEVNPGQWKELIAEVNETKSRLNDRKYATTGSKHMERRFLLRMPEFVHNVIWKMYPDYDMNREFFNKFARRYPAYRVSEKI